MSLQECPDKKASLRVSYHKCRTMVSGSNEPEDSFNLGIKICGEVQQSIPESHALDEAEKLLQMQ